MAKPKLSPSLRAAWKRQGFTQKSVFKMRNAVLAEGHSGKPYSYRADIPYQEQIDRIKADIAAVRKAKKQPGWSELELGQFDVDIQMAQKELKHIQWLQKYDKAKKAGKRNG